MKKILFVMFLFITQSSFASTEAELKEMIATIININGLLCAKVESVHPLSVGKNVYEVTCTTYRGGQATKTYVMDAIKGRAWEQ